MAWKVAMPRRLAVYSCHTVHHKWARTCGPAAAPPFPKCRRGNVTPALLITPLPRIRRLFGKGWRGASHGRGLVVAAGRLPGAGAEPTPPTSTRTRGVREMSGERNGPRDPSLLSSPLTIER